MRWLTFALAIFLLCAALPAQVSPSQDIGSRSWHSIVTSPYVPKEAPPIDLANSPRLEQLLRAGNIYLSLRDAIALALENNLDIQLQRYSRPIAEAQLKRAKAGGSVSGATGSIQNSTMSALSMITGGAGLAGSGMSIGGTSSASGTGSLDPVFYASGQWGHQSSPQVNSFVAGGTSIAYQNRQFSTGVRKAFLTGTSFDYGWDNNWLRTNSSLVDFNPSATAAMRLTISQHLLQGFGLAVNSRNIKIASNNVRAADQVFRQQVIQTVSGVIEAYWRLVSLNEAVKVREQALALAQKLYDDNKKQVELGTMARYELVLAEAEVAANEEALVQAQTPLTEQETALKNVLSRTGIASPALADAHIIAVDRITVPEQEQPVPLQDLMAEALANRPELKQMRLNLDSARLNLLGTKSAMLPSLDAIVQLQNNALVGQAVQGASEGGTNFTPTSDPFFIGGFGRSLAQLFARNFPDYTVGFQLNIPIHNRAAQADMTAAQLSLRQQQIQEQSLINSIRVQVRNAMVEVEQARVRYRAAVRSRQLAEQKLDNEQKRFALGAGTMFYVIQYQRDLDQARSNEVTAASAYAIAKVQLDEAIGRTLEANNISIDEAVRGVVSRPPDARP
jgi:outer membrane protein